VCLYGRLRRPRGSDRSTASAFASRLRLGFYPGGMSFDWSQLSPADRLRLLVFDAELRRVPRPLIDALWAGVDALEREMGSQVGSTGSGPSAPLLSIHY
jgi:hypothetical protein